MVIAINLYELVDDGDGRRAFDSSPVIDSDGTLLGVSRMMHITQCTFVLMLVPMLITMCVRA